MRWKWLKNINKTVDFFSSEVESWYGCGENLIRNKDKVKDILFHSEMWKEEFNYSMIILHTIPGKKTLFLLMLTLSHEVVLQNYDIIDVWLSVFSYAITLELLNLLLCLLAWSEWLFIYFVFQVITFTF